MKKQAIRDIIEGKVSDIDDIFAIKYKKPPVSYKGKAGAWFTLRLADRTGEISAMFWGGEDAENTRKIYDSLSDADVVHVKGTRDSYNSKVQISIDSEKGMIRKCSSAEYEITDFIPMTNKEIEEMKRMLRRFIESVNDDKLRLLLDSFFKDADFMKVFERFPAAMHYHQNWIGGLLEHTLNVAKICETVSGLHPELDRDILITGALLHDIGKTREFELKSVINVSKEGQLLGHVTIGKVMASRKIEEIEGFTPELRNKILHMILSHQGQLEYGSPKEPQLPEAYVLYYADECDAKASYVLKKKKDANTESPWIWDRGLGRAIYLE